MQRHLWLGAEEARYGRLRAERLGPGLAAALSVGADPRSPSLAFKGRREVPNEDGLAAVVDGPRLLLAVADGHMGCEGSHGLVQRVWESSRIPASPGELSLLALSLGEPPWPGPAGTTLVLACLDQRDGTGFGMAWGDSTAHRLGAGKAELLTRPGPSFLYAGQPPEPSLAQVFSFELAPGELLLLTTDGVTECHYGSPATSVTPELMARLYLPAPEEYARRLGEQALLGVGGHPGGQDNLALLVAGRL